MEKLRTEAFVLFAQCFLVNTQNAKVAQWQKILVIRDVMKLLIILHTLHKIAVLTQKNSNSPPKKCGNFSKD